MNKLSANMSFKRAFDGIVSGSLGLFGLASHDNEMDTQQSDRLMLSNGGYSTTVDQAAVAPVRVGEHRDETFRSALDVAGDRQTVAERYYLVHHNSWTTSQVLGTSIGQIEFPHIFQSDLYAINGLLKYHQYVRYDLEVVIQINPTSFQNGGLLAWVEPATTLHGGSPLCNCPTFPSGFLNCNVNNMVTIKVPFTYTRNQYQLHNNTGPDHVHTLNIAVWEQLKVASGTSTICDVRVLARMCNVQLHGIRPAADATMRAQILPVQVVAGQGVINTANQSQLVSSANLALGDEELLVDSSFAGGLRCTNLDVQLRTPCRIKNFSWSTTSSAGTQLCKMPVGPWQTAESWGHVVSPCNLTAVSQFYRYWRGDIIFTTQFFPTKYHSGRVIAVFIPGPEEVVSTTQPLEFLSTCMNYVFDLGVQSTMAFRVPYISAMMYENVKGAVCTTGWWYLYVYTQLAAPNNVSTEVGCVVNVSAGENFELYVPSYNLPQAGDQDPGDMVTDVVPQQVDAPTPAPTDMAVVKSGPAGSLEMPQYKPSTTGTFPELKDGKRLHTRSHTDLRNLLGRAQYATEFVYSNAQYINYNYQVNINAMKGVMGSIMQMFTFFRGRLKLVVMVETASSVDVSISFRPLDASSINTFEDSARYGMARISTDQTTQVTVTLPWYTKLSALGMQSTDGFFGYVHFYGRVGGATTFKLLLAFDETSSLYFPRACPIGSYYKPAITTRDAAFIHQVDAPVVSARPRMVIQGSDGDPVAYLCYVQRLMYKHYFVEINTGELIGFRVIGTGPGRYFGLGMVVYEKPTVVAGYIREQVIYEDLTYLHDMVGRTCKYNALTYNCEHWARQHCFLRCESLQQDKVAAAAFGMTAGALNMLAQGGDDKDVKPKSKQGLMGMVTGASKLADSMETFPASMSKHIETTVELSLGKISDTIVRTVNDSFADISLTSDIASMAQEVRDVAAEIKNAKLSQLTSVVGDAACSSSANVNVTAQQMGEAAASISKLSDQVRDILQRATGGPLKSKYGSKIASKVMKWFTRLAQSFVVVYLCYKNPIPTVLVPVSVYMGLGVFGKLFGMLGDRLMCRAQSADNEEDEQAVMDILSSMVYEAVAQAVPAKFHPEGGCTGFVQQIRTAGLVSTALKSIIGMVAFVVNAIKKAVSYFVPDEKCKASRKLVEHRSSMLGWCVRANRLLASINDNDKDLPRKYATLAADGEKYLAWFLLAGDQAADSKLYRRICELLNKMDMCVTPAIRDEACIARVEPVVVYFYGEKGVGKSVATFSLAAQICKEMGWDPFTNIYTKPVSAQYYDGYKQQKVMIIDDMGQCSDGRDYEDFCQIVSSAPLRLNMAHLSNKGTHFTTPFIIVSSNVPIPRPASVVCPAAINRRLELKYEVKPADPYKTADGLLDFGAAKTAGTLKKATCLVFKHHDNNALNTQTAGVPKTMDQIVLAVIQKLTAKSSNFQDIMQMFVQGKGDERNWTDSSYHQYCESIRLQRTAEGSWDPLAEDDDDDTGYSSEDMSSIGDIIQEEIMPKWKMVLIGIATAVATVSALTAAAFGIHKLVEHHKKKKEGGTQAAYAPTTQAPVRKLHRAPPVQQQGSNEVIRIVQKNLVQLGYVKHNTIHYVLNAIFTHDNQLLVPYHFFHYATNHNIVIRDPSSVIENEYEQGALKVVRLEHEGKPLDACLITVPNRQPSRDIRKHFVRRDDLGKVPGTNAILATIVGQNFTLVPETELTMKSEASYGMAEQTCVTSDVIMATASTGIGFCGGALISNLTTIQNAILGVHVAGNGMMAFTQIITVEMLNTPMVAEGRIQTVKPGPQIGTPTKTAFSVSPLAEYFESGKEPAALGCKDRRVEVDPFAVALEKYGSALKAPPHDWKECVDGVSQLMVDRVGCIDGDLSTFDAINGIPGLDAVNMKTSAGWPWVGVGKSKRDLIETHVQNGKQVLIPTPELNEALEEHEETIENAGPIDIKYVTYFKDELRPTSKIRQGKTRIIESAPVHHVVAFRKVFGRAIARLHQSDPFVSGLAVGMDVDQDFSALYVKMAMFGEQLFDLDYTCFDGRLQPFVISAAFRILARLANVSEFVGDAYAQRLIHSFHLFQGLEIEVIGGMPSGSPATTIINSICNQLMVYYVLARCLGCPLFQVFDHVRPIVYGDDVLLVVKHGVSANLEDLPSVMLDVFGAVVTDASKSGKPYVKSIDQVTFLKRSFVVDKSVYLVVHPAIDKCTIEAMLQYQRKGEKYPDRIDAALWMAYHHGEDVYNRYVHRIRVACAHVGYRYDNIPRFEEMNTIMMKKIFG